MRLTDLVIKRMQRNLENLCKKELEISELPEIILVDDDSIGGTSFGQFDGKTIKVVAKNRHPMDIMRTLAHEIVHHKQMQDGEKMDGKDGSSTENDANAIAGVILRKFGRLYPEYFDNN